jgi:tRNA(His) 5'-end guanylyltransferase
MKAYEAPWRAVMTRRVPVIIRVDGKAFHTFARGCARPFDAGLMSAMDAVAVELCKEIQGAQLAYVQSDEVSVLVHGYRTIQTQPWVNNEVQKMVSLTASVATAAFSDAWAERTQSRALFDSRVFLVPEDEVCNYFIWRQQDATRNSIQMTARAHFSDKDEGSTEAP